jgi:hypothetical protein
VVGGGGGARAAADDGWLLMVDPPKDEDRGTADDAGVAAEEVAPRGASASDAVRCLDSAPAACVWAPTAPAIEEGLMTALLLPSWSVAVREDDDWLLVDPEAEEGATEEAGDAVELVPSLMRSTEEGC